MADVQQSEVFVCNGEESSEAWVLVDLWWHPGIDFCHDEMAQQTTQWLCDGWSHTWQRTEDRRSVPGRQCAAVIAIFYSALSDLPGVGYTNSDLWPTSFNCNLTVSAVPYLSSTKTVRLSWGAGQISSISTTSLTMCALDYHLLRSR